MTPPVPPVSPSSPEQDPTLPAWARKKPTVQGEPSDAELAAFVGPRWAVYEKKLQPFRDDASFVPTWNWAAALLSSPWMLYRKLYLGFALFFVASRLSIPLFLGAGLEDLQKNPTAPENRERLILLIAVQVALSVAAGGSANWLLYRRARAAKRLLALQQVPSDQAPIVLGKIGGVNRGVAMFFVVLLVVLAIGEAWAMRSTGGG